MFRGIRLTPAQIEGIVVLATRFWLEKPESDRNRAAEFSASEKQARLNRLFDQRDSYARLLTAHQRPAFMRNTNAILAAWLVQRTAGTSSSSHPAVKQTPPPPNNPGSDSLRHGCDDAGGGS